MVKKKHGSEVISSCFSDLQKTYPNCAQELAQNYCSGGSFISLTDAFFNWHVLREEINPSTTNDNNDDGIGEGLGIATTNSLSVRKLLTTPIHPTLHHSKFNEHGMEPHDAKLTMNVDVENAMQVLTCLVVNCRPICHNLLAHYSTTKEKIHGHLLKLAMSSMSSQRLTAEGKSELKIVLNSVITESEDVTM